MPINVSATGLADFLQCSMRTNYRINHPELGISNDAMAIGTIVHNTIESFYNNKESALREAKSALSKVNIQDTDADDKIAEYINNFFTLNSGGFLVNETSKQELSFKLPIDKNSNIVGRIDCITGNSVFDWKTGSTRKRQLENDIQCILYSHVVERMFSFKPQVYMVYLKDLKILKYTENAEFKRTLLYDIIPKYLRAVRNQEYTRDGIFTNSCTMCSYKAACLSE